MSRPLAHRLGGLGLAVLLAAGCAGTPAEKAALAPAGADLGIRVESLRLTAADHLLDLRYRITDPVRAEALFSRKTDIQLIDSASGARLAVPNTAKLGRLRQVAQRDKTERSYFMLFANPGHAIRPGARLTLVVGDTRLEGLRVEGPGDNHDPNAQL
jgi:hypothetical protein